MRIALAFVLISSLLASRAVAGRSSSGGANICKLPNGPSVLLDLAHLPLVGLLPGDQIPLTYAQRQYGFVLYEMNPKSRAVIAASQILTRLPEELRFFSKMIESAIGQMSFIAVPIRFEKPVGAFFEKDSLCSSHNTEAVFVYSGTAAFLSVPLWNTLTLETQSYALIHEGIRHAQKALGLDLDDRQLQNLTEILIRNLPLQNDAEIYEVLARYRGVDAYKEGICRQERIARGKSQVFGDEAIEILAAACANPLQIERALLKISEFQWRGVLADNRDDSDAKDLFKFVSDTSVALTLRRIDQNSLNLVVLAHSGLLKMGSSLTASCTESRGDAFNRDPGEPSFPDSGVDCSKIQREFRALLKAALSE